MKLNNTSIQLLIIVIGIVSISIGIKTKLQNPPVYFKTWVLVSVSYLLIFIFSLLLGFFIKVILKSSWSVFTFTSIVMTVSSLSYYFREYKHAYTVYIPDEYVGAVRLYISNDNTHDLYINDYGIGYISYRTFGKGFRPTIIKNGLDITEQISGFASTNHSDKSNESYVIDYKSFIVPGGTTKELVGFNQLVMQNAIDTTRLRRK